MISSKPHLHQGFSGLFSTLWNERGSGIRMSGLCYVMPGISHIPSPGQFPCSYTGIGKGGPELKERVWPLLSCPILLWFLSSVALERTMLFCCSLAPTPKLRDMGERVFSWLPLENAGLTRGFLAWWRTQYLTQCAEFSGLTGCSIWKVEMRPMRPQDMMDRTPVGWSPWRERPLPQGTPFPAQVTGGFSNLHRPRPIIFSYFVIKKKPPPHFFIPCTWPGRVAAKWIHLVHWNMLSLPQMINTDSVCIHVNLKNQYTDCMRSYWKVWGRMLWSPTDHTVSIPGDPGARAFVLQES